MTVAELITKLNQVENKEQEVVVGIAEANEVDFFMEVEVKSLFFERGGKTVIDTEIPEQWTFANKKFLDGDVDEIN